MVLPDSNVSHLAHAHQHNHQSHSHHLDDPKNAEYAALEAQFFEYNQISDAFTSIGFGGYDMLQHQPSNEFGLSLDLMNLPPPAYAAHHHHHHHLPPNSSSNHNNMDMETSPLYSPMEAMSINPSMTTMSPHPQSANPNALQHNPGSTQSHQIPLPPSPTGSTSSLQLPPSHSIHQQHVSHNNSANGLGNGNGVLHPHPHINTSSHSHSQMMHSPMGLMSSDLSAGALSSACSSAGSPESHRGVSLPTIEQKELREPSHGRTGSNASEKRFNPMKGTRGSPSATGNAVATTAGRTTRKRAGTANSLREKKEDIKVNLKEEDHDSDDDDLDFAPIAAKSDKPLRREEIRKQRIESEQRRRDELREGYRRLKEALPSSNQKSSKVALLDRAVNHVRYMEMTRQQLQVRLNSAEMEMSRLRQVNEALMLGTAEQRAAAAVASAAVQAHVQPQY